MLVTGGAVWYLFPGITNTIGSGFYPDATTTLVKYPGTPILAEQSIGRGVDNLDAAIKSADGPIVVAGLSEGSMVIDHEQARLLNDPEAPPADQVTFIIFGNPERGILALLPEGTYVPLVGYTSTTPVESQYDTIIVTGEYDGFADPPDRPWNLASTLNAFIGAGVVHSLYADVDPASIPKENVTHQGEFSKGHGDRVFGADRETPVDAAFAVHRATGSRRPGRRCCASDCRCGVYA